MRKTQHSRTEQLWRNIKLFMVVWTLVIGTSLGWNLFYQRDRFQTTLHTEAAAFHTMEMEYRNWIIHNGGVYVPVTDKTPPSPWLSEVPERDVITPSGKKLTLLNSSYVVRLVHQAMTGAKTPLRGSIASLHPINPVNAADAWERKALEAFARGGKTLEEIEVMDDGKTYFRYMKPMVTEEACLKCHARYGDKLGDIRGGVSIAVPIDGYLIREGRERIALIAGHGVIWGIGLVGLLIGGRRQQRAIAEAERSEAQVRQSQALLDSIVENIPAMVFLKRAEDLRFELFNRAGEQLLGYSRNDLLGMNVSDFLPEDQAEIMSRQDRETLDSHRPLDIPEQPIKIADGRQKWLHTLKIGLYDEADNPTHLLGVAIDISAQKRMQDALRESLEGTVRTVSLAAELRDPYTAGHQRRVAELAEAIAREMGLPEETIHGLKLAANIHDLGKINVPPEILAKPGKLNDIEFMLLRTHPDTAMEILKDVSFPWPIAEIIVQHHEKLDGSGYPHGLKGDQIRIESRILTVADVVEAMASNRPYRPTLGIEAALKEIERGRGSAYDPAVVDACLKLFREGRFTY